MGLSVSVVEGFNRLLPRQLDVSASEMLEKSLEEAGIEITKNFFASAILGNETVEGLQLINGDVIECDMVILSSGIVPNIEMAKEIGINTGRGIIVNEYMETSIKDIYAAGDVAEYKGISYGLWSVAIDQGNVAGARAVGDEITSKIACPSAIFTTLGINLFSIGNVGGFERDNVKALIDTDLAEDIYKKFYFKDDKIVGGFLYGDVSKSLQIVNAVSNGFSVQDVVNSLY
jgi:NAD(P)H-nitrite reductase large subunit